MKTQSNRSKLSVLVALVFLATVLGASPAHAIIIICKSGMIGFTTGRTARVNVVNYGDPDQRPVAVSVKFLNKDGDVLGEFRLTDPLQPGKAAAFDLNRDDLVGAAPGRHELRVEVTYGDPDEKKADDLRNRVRITIEIINNETGKTEVFWGDPDD
jgi:hypothetical protein